MRDSISRFTIGRRQNRLRGLLAIALVLAQTAIAVPVLAAPKKVPKARLQPAAAAPAGAKDDPRELRAREAFAIGRYQEALDLFAKLYAEKPHPNYLRNIGRCYQNLKDPERAINSFREYLRQSKAISAAENAEVEGYIRELEAMRDNPGVAPSAPATPAPAPVPVLSGDPAAADPAVSASLADRAPAAPSDPIYKRWWFWAALGVVAAGTVAIVVLGSGSASDPACPPGRTCP